MARAASEWTTKGLMGQTDRQRKRERGRETRRERQAEGQEGFFLRPRNQREWRRVMGLRVMSGSLQGSSWAWVDGRVMEIDEANERPLDGKRG